MLARPFAPLPLLLLMGFAALAATPWLKYGDLTAIKLPWRDNFEQTSVDPKAVAYVKSGDTLAAQGEYDDAIEEYTQALTIDSSYTVAYEGRADVYFYQGYYDLAIADYDRIILLRPKYVEFFHFRRAVAYYNKGDYERAIAGYNEVIKLNPRFAPAYANRNLAYANRNNSGAPSPITFGQSAAVQTMQTPGANIASPATGRTTANEPRNERWPTMARQSGWTQNTPWHSAPAASSPRTTTAAPRAVVSQSGFIRRQH